MDKSSVPRYVPAEAADADLTVGRLIGRDLEALPREDFLKLWYAVAYLNPGLHPDGYETADSGWPEALQGVAAEAWRRATLGELGDEELYPADAAWAGVCDRLAHPPESVIDRRAWMRVIAQGNQTHPEPC